MFDEEIHVSVQQPFPRRLIHLRQVPHEPGRYQGAHDGIKNVLGYRGCIIPLLCVRRCKPLCRAGGDRYCRAGLERTACIVRIYSIRTCGEARVAVNATTNEEYDDLRDVHHKENTQDDLWPTVHRIHAENHRHSNYRHQLSSSRICQWTMVAHFQHQPKKWGSQIA